MEWMHLGIKTAHGLCCNLLILKHQVKVQDASGRAAKFLFIIFLCKIAICDSHCRRSAEKKVNKKNVNENT